MQHDPTAAVVRIFKPDGSTAGTGFVVTDQGLVVTCAHVVKRTEPDVRRPDGTRLSAEVVSVHETDDVALLQLTVALPAGVIPVEFAPSLGWEGLAVRAFGYPKLGDTDGLYGVGQMVGHVTKAGRARLQLSFTQVTAGFSGGPVWNAVSGRVIGMVVEFAPPDRYGKLGDVAFAIPAETLRDLCPEITLVFARPQSEPPGQLWMAVPAPPAAPRLFGRDRFLDDLARELTSVAGGTPLALTALRGLPGVGKTALARALAGRADVAAAFRDGRAWLPLGPNPDLASLLGRLLEQFGAPSTDLSRVEELADRLRAVLAGRRCLLLLDDVWRAEHARPFLEACSPPTRALFTTRYAQLAADVHAALHEVRILKPEPALAMLEAAGEWAAQAVAADRDGAEALVLSLGYLPLALHVAGRRLNGLAFATGAAGSVARLRRELKLRLLAFTAADPRPGLLQAEPSLEAILALSYDALPDDATRRALRRLAVLGGQPLDFAAAAMAAIWEADEDQTTQLCMSLLDAGLMERREEGGTGRAEEARYQLHQVIAIFAAGRLGTDPVEAQAAARAHARHYATVAEAASDQIAGAHLLDGLAQLDAEIGQVRRAIGWARAQHDPFAAEVLRDLVVPLRNFAIGARNLHTEYGGWLDDCLVACGALQDKRGEANVLQAQGDVLAFQDRRDEALARYEQALGLFRAVGARLGEANVLKAQGDASLRAGQVEQGMALLEQARRLYAAIGDRVGLSNVGIVLAHHAATQGDLAAAIEYVQPAADFCTEINHPLGAQLQQQIEQWQARLEQQAAMVAPAA